MYYVYMYKQVINFKDLGVAKSPYPTLDFPQKGPTFAPRWGRFRPAGAGSAPLGPFSAAPQHKKLVVANRYLGDFAVLPEPFCRPSRALPGVLPPSFRRPSEPFRPSFPDALPPSFPDALP